MADQVSTISTADGIAKRIHGTVQDMLPAKRLSLTKRLKYDADREVGLEYAEQVILTAENGFTYGGTSGAARNLNAPAVAKSKLAKLTPSSVHFRTRMVIELMAQAEAAGPKAFASAITQSLTNSKRAMDIRQEIKHKYGGSPIGVITSATDAGTSSVFTFTAGKWMPGVWLGSSGMAIDVYDGSTQLNTRADIEVTSVDVGAKTITVSGNADDIDAIVAAGANTDLYYKGAYNNDGTGLKSIAALTAASPNYLDISCATYSDVWNGTQIQWNSATTEFSWGLFNEGMEEAASRGFDGDAIAEVPYPVWRQLCSSLDALRVLDSSYSANKGEMGHMIDSLQYHSITGKITIEPTRYIMTGDVLVYPDPADENNDHFARIGTSKPTFQQPGGGGQMIDRISGTNYVEMCMFACDAVWLPSPRSLVLFTP